MVTDTNTCLATVASSQPSCRNRRDQCSRRHCPSHFHCLRKRTFLCNHKSPSVRHYALDGDDDIHWRIVYVTTPRVLLYGQHAPCALKEEATQLTVYTDDAGDRVPGVRVIKLESCKVSESGKSLRFGVCELASESSSELAHRVSALWWNSPSAADYPLIILPHMIASSARWFYFHVLRLVGRVVCYFQEKKCTHDETARCSQ